MCVVGVWCPWLLVRDGREVVSDPDRATGELALFEVPDMTTTPLTYRARLKVTLSRWHDRWCGPRTIYAVRVITWVAVGVSWLRLFGFLHHAT